MRARWGTLLLAAASWSLIWGCGDAFKKGGGTGGTSACSNDDDCDHLNQGCERGRCDAGQCVSAQAPDGAFCDDGLHCTEGSTCSSGACGTPVECTQPGDPCQQAVCREQAGGCVTEPGNDGAVCDDGDPCTGGDACASGTCEADLITSCEHGDGCCPDGCTSAEDPDCACLVNLALQAVASSSPGNPDPLGPTYMNDGRGQPETCECHWITNNSTWVGAYIQLDWPSDVTIASLYVDTENATSPACGGQPGRNLAAGEVQAWVGGLWTPVVSFQDEVDDVQLDFSPVTTKGLRIFNAVSGPGNGNTRIYEWYVYPDPGCIPPGLER